MMKTARWGFRRFHYYPYQIVTKDVLAECDDAELHEGAVCVFLRYIAEHIHMLTPEEDEQEDFLLRLLSSLGKYQLLRLVAGQHTPLFLFRRVTGYNIE